MSEKKLNAVKNDEGEWMSLDGTQTEIWYSNNPTLFKDKSYAEAQSMGRKAHVVELVEPEKVVLTKKQAEIVENAHDEEYPATYICNYPDTGDSGEEELLMKAFANGYTVAKEKKYRLPVPKSWCGDNDHYWRKESDGTLTWSILSGRAEDFEFTKDEIGKFELQDCEKEEVTDDAD